MDDDQRDFYAIGDETGVFFHAGLYQSGEVASWFDGSNRYQDDDPLTSRDLTHAEAIHRLGPEEVERSESTAIDFWSATIANALETKDAKDLSYAAWAAQAWANLLDQRIIATNA